MSSCSTFGLKYFYGRFLIHVSAEIGKVVMSKVRISAEHYEIMHSSLVTLHDFVRFGSESLPVLPSIADPFFMKFLHFFLTKKKAIE